jgi:branched-subunit amino acid ABC-type transport system permease component
MLLDDFLNTLIRGVQAGSLYALVAVGLSISFRATKVFNFAHGEFVMVGTVVGVLVWQDANVPVVGSSSEPLSVLCSITRTRNGSSRHWVRR